MRYKISIEYGEKLTNCNKVLYLPKETGFSSGIFKADVLTIFGYLTISFYGKPLAAIGIDGFCVPNNVKHEDLPVIDFRPGRLLLEIEGVEERIPSLFDDILGLPSVYRDYQDMVLTHSEEIAILFDHNTGWMCFYLRSERKNISNWSDSAQIMENVIVLVKASNLYCVWIKYEEMRS